MVDLQAFFNIFKYDGSIPIRMSISYSMVPNTIMSLGTNQHQHLLEKIGDGSVCMNMSRPPEFLLIIIKLLIYCL